MISDIFSLGTAFIAHLAFWRIRGSAVDQRKAGLRFVGKMCVSLLHIFIIGNCEGGKCSVHDSVRVLLGACIIACTHE